MIVIGEKRFIGGVLYSFWANALVSLAVAVALTGLAEWLLIGLFQPGWFALITVGLCGTIVYAAVLFATGYVKKEERAVLGGLIANWRSR